MPSGFETSDKVVRCCDQKSKRIGDVGGGGLEWIDSPLSLQSVRIGDEHEEFLFLPAQFAADRRGSGARDIETEPNGGRLAEWPRRSGEVVEKFCKDGSSPYGPTTSFE